MSDGGSGPTVIGHQKHTYHLVDPSPWPIVGAIAAGLLTSGTVMGMHGHGWYLCVAGAVGVIMTMYVWWRDVINEATFQGYHTPVVRLGMRYGMTLFITSEVMFFSAFFWAFFSSSLFPAAGVWPPAGVKPFDPLDLPLLNTLILLLSATTVTWAHHSIIEGKRSQALQGLACTILLGMTFTSCQAIEYSHAGFTFSGNIFGATFFMATGFHGAHVIIGTIFLVVCWFRAYRGDFKPEHHFGFEAAAWYWHFVDVVWLFLYFCIYVWGGGVGAIGSE